MAHFRIFEFYDVKLSDVCKSKIRKWREQLSKVGLASTFDNLIYDVYFQISFNDYKSYNRSIDRTIIWTIPLFRSWAHYAEATGRLMLSVYFCHFQVTDVINGPIEENDVINHYNSPFSKPTSASNGSLSKRF